MLEVLEAQMDRAGKLIANVQGDKWTSASPCKEFDALGVANHMIGFNVMLKQVLDGKKPDQLTFPDPAGGDDAAAAYERTKSEVIETLRKPGALDGTFAFPFGELNGEQTLGLSLMEIVVHSWDVARASGQDEEIDPTIASTVLEGAKASISDQYRNPDGNPFAPAVEVGDDATPTQKLVAFFGRQP